VYRPRCAVVSAASHLEEAVSRIDSDRHCWMHFVLELPERTFNLERSAVNGHLNALGNHHWSFTDS
jgi:hypothetical protein